MPLMAGALAPLFSAPTRSRTEFSFGSLGGTWIVLLFLGGEAGPDDAARQLLETHRDLFDDRHMMAFTIVRDAETFARTPESLPGLRVFHDVDGGIAGRFHVRREDGGTFGYWTVIDPTLRVIDRAPLADGPALFDRLRRLPPPVLHAGTPMHAPVLIVPRVFEPAFCRRLIEVYDRDGGDVSGVMRDIGGMTVPVVDGFKRRRDATITDEALRAEIRSRLSNRLLPMIRKALMFEVTHVERYIVACYDADDGGYFRAHRDNTTLATAHRQFACSINLNAEEFEGGDLRFPEFGPQTYRPPTGGAVIFSCALLHEATPVTRGKRYAYLPFFYDAAHARIRAENARYLKAGEDAPATAA
jgi:predicted 2-oxoglutarate/Fe(II)-dependent dioxygenase YbiX/peroxiredoxin